MVDVAVVVEVEKLSAGRLARIGVVRGAAVSKLTERRGRAEERDALVPCLEVLMDMAGKHDPYRAAAKDPEQPIAADQPAVGLNARRQGRMVQTEHDVRLDPIESASKPSERAIGDAPALVPDPLAVQQSQRPLLRKRDEPPILDLAEHGGIAAVSSWFPAMKYLRGALRCVSRSARRYASIVPSSAMSPVTTVASTGGSAFITDARFSAGFRPHTEVRGSDRRCVSLT
jgi:hypothetical protein